MLSTGTDGENSTQSCMRQTSPFDSIMDLAIKKVGCDGNGNGGGDGNGNGNGGIVGKCRAVSVRLYRCSICLSGTQVSKHGFRLTEGPT